MVSQVHACGPLLACECGRQAGLPACCAVPGSVMMNNLRMRGRLASDSWYSCAQMCVMSLRDGGWLHC